MNPDEFQDREELKDSKEYYRQRVAILQDALLGRWEALRAAQQERRDAHTLLKSIQDRAQADHDNYQTYINDDDAELPDNDSHSIVEDIKTFLDKHQ